MRGQSRPTPHRAEAAVEVEVEEAAVEVEADKQHVLRKSQMELVLPTKSASLVIVSPFHNFPLFPERTGKTFLKLYSSTIKDGLAV